MDHGGAVGGVGSGRQAEDVARLSPLGYDNINFLGRYSFEFDESVAELRPLRSLDPDQSPLP